MFEAGYGFGVGEGVVFGGLCRWHWPRRERLLIGLARPDDRRRYQRQDGQQAEEDDEWRCRAPLSALGLVAHGRDCGKRSEKRPGEGLRALLPGSKRKQMDPTWLLGLCPSAALPLESRYAGPEGQSSSPAAGSDRSLS